VIDGEFKDAIILNVKKNEAHLVNNHQCDVRMNCNRCVVLKNFALVVRLSEHFGMVGHNTKKLVGENSSLYLSL
jgi:hypothetical protein